MFGEYKKDPTGFVERLFDKFTSRCVHAGWDYHNSKACCGISMVYTNGYSEKCEKHWISHSNIIRGIIDISGAVTSYSSDQNAEVVFYAMQKDGYFIDKRCRKAAGGPLGWVFGVNDEYQFWYFDTDKIGN